MSFLFFAWHNFLYIPLLNVLVWLYNGPAHENIVWSVVLLTLLLRFLLLPLTIISEANKGKYEKMKDQFVEINNKFHNDQVQKKDEIRKLLKKHKFSPWAKATVLVVQVLVFVVLYQVFLGGVRGKISASVLYSWVDLPIYINTDFYGFNAAESSLFWSLAAAFLLLFDVLQEQKHQRGRLTKKDLFYTILFPGSVFVFLWILPMVKSIFIITTLLFSIVIAYMGRAFQKKN